MAQLPTNIAAGQAGHIGHTNELHAGHNLNEDHRAALFGAHPASAIWFDPSGLIVVSTDNVQDALEQLDAAVAAGSGGSGALVAAKMVKSTTQVVADNVYSQVVFGAEEVDTHGFWDAATPSSLVVPAGQAGSYEVVGSYQISGANAIGVKRYIQIDKNATKIGAMQVAPAGVGNDSIVQCVVPLVTLAVGDTLKLFMVQDSNNNQTIRDDDATTYLMCRRVA